MSFLFATSHLPENTRLKGILRGAARPPEEDEDEEDPATQPAPRSGSVRAISHLPDPMRAQADSDDPLSTRPAIPVGRPRPPATPEEDHNHDDAPDTDHEDTDHAPEPDSALHDAPEDDTGPHEPEDSSPWYQPRISATDLHPQDHHENEEQDAHASSPESGHDFPDSSEARGFGPPPDLGPAMPPDSVQGPFPREGTAPAASHTLLKSPLFKDRMPQRTLAHVKDQPSRPFRNAADPQAAAGPARSHFAAAAAQHVGQAQQPQITTAAPSPASGPAPATSALEPANRIHERDETDPGPPPKQRVEGTSSKNKPREQFDKEKAAYEKAAATAKANKKFNQDNKQILKAWKNYDRAIEMLHNAPEGQKVLEHLRNDKTRVFRVVMLNNPATEDYMGERLSPGAQAQHIDTGKKDEQGREIHLILLSKPALEGDVLKPDGKVNPDAESLEKVWHELYHASERNTSGGVDPLGLGTTSTRDRLFPQSHERRAVRFENIIRFRNGGTRRKNKYGGSWKKGPDGKMYIKGEIDVPDDLPPRPASPSN